MAAVAYQERAVEEWAYGGLPTACTPIRWSATPKMNLDTNEIESEDIATDRNSKIYKDMRTPNYTVDIF